MRQKRRRQKEEKLGREGNARGVALKLIRNSGAIAHLFTHNFRSRTGEDMCRFVDASRDDNPFNGHA